MKYAGTPPYVTVSLKLSNETVTCRITDNGQGIPETLRRKIFGRFVRLGKELRREKPGTGLGLHIVSTLVKRARGKVMVVDPESVEEDPNIKTIFEVRLPGRPLRTSTEQEPSTRLEPDSPAQV